MTLSLSLNLSVSLHPSLCRSGTIPNAPVSSIAPCWPTALGCLIVSMVTTQGSPASSSSSTGYVSTLAWKHAEVHWSTDLSVSTCLSLQVIGMLPGKEGQSPYVTCGAKVSEPKLVSPVFLPVSPHLSHHPTSPASPSHLSMSHLLSVLCFLRGTGWRGTNG